MCLQLPLHYFEREAKDKINQNLLGLMMGLEERGEEKENLVLIILHMYMIS
jgi:hypothetical protein